MTQIGSWRVRRLTNSRTATTSYSSQHYMGAKLWCCSARDALEANEVRFNKTSPASLSLEPKRLPHGFPTLMCHLTKLRIMFHVCCSQPYVFLVFGDLPWKAVHFKEVLPVSFPLQGLPRDQSPTPATSHLCRCTSVTPHPDEYVQITAG